MAKQEEITNPQNIEVGKRIQDLRKCNNITQEKLAATLNISQRHMVHIETGKRGLTPDNASVLADFFSTSLDYIYRGKAASGNMLPVCQMVYDTFTQFQNEEQRNAYLDTIVSLSNLLHKL